LSLQTRLSDEELRALDTPQVRDHSSQGNMGWSGAASAYIAFRAALEEALARGAEREEAERVLVGIADTLNQELRENEGGAHQVGSVKEDMRSALRLLVDSVRRVEQRRTEKAEAALAAARDLLETVLDTDGFHMASNVESQIRYFLSTPFPAGERIRAMEKVVEAVRRWHVASAFSDNAAAVYNAEQNLARSLSALDAIERGGKK